LFIVNQFSLIKQDKTGNNFRTGRFFLLEQQSFKSDTISVRPESIMEDRWLSVDEIGAYLGIKRDTVYKWLSEKQMPAHRMGRLWKFRKEEVDKWVKTGGADDKGRGHGKKTGKK
jgi:excisionase family DNA binding protein